MKAEMMQYMLIEQRFEKANELMNLEQGMNINLENIIYNFYMD